MKTYGSKAAQIGKENLPDVKCAYCHTNGTVDMFFFYRYYHFFGIPLLPHRRGGAIMCSNCKHVTNAKLFPIDLKEHFMEEKKKYKPPYWQYLGSVTITLLVVSFLTVKFFMYGTVSQKSFLAGIKPNNIYKYSLSRSRYTFWKITRVNNDSIYYLPSNYEFSGTPPKAIDFSKEDFFDTASERIYLRSEFKRDFEGKKIRKYK
jgi:hypothetical protein